MNQWQPYLISTAIGLLVGIEREKDQHDQKEMGVRTFLLISLIGAIAGDVQNSLLSVVFATFVFGLILISYCTQFTTCFGFNRSYRGADSFLKNVAASFYKRN